MARNANIMSFDDAKQGRRTRRQASSPASSAAQSRSQAHSRMSKRIKKSDARPKGRLPLNADEVKTHRLSEEFDAFPQAAAGAPRSVAVGLSPSGRLRVMDPAATEVTGDARAAIQSYDEFLEEEAENGAAPQTAKDKRAAAREQRKRAARKQEAERKFAKAYGGQQGASSEGAPRAAIYKGEMGRKHKRSSKMQQAVATSSAALQSFEIKRPKSFSTKRIAVGAVLACVLFACLFLYEPARVYYTEMREVARLELEYQAVLDRNDTIEFDVDLLQTDRGIQDKAREMLGWIPADEQAASVVGAEFTTNSNFSAHVVSEAIKPPATWYSPILDPLFGVS